MATDFSRFLINPGNLNQSIAKANPSKAKLNVQRGKVPQKGDKEGLAEALNRLNKFKAEDRVRILNRASQAGIVEKGKAAAVITGTLANQPKPSMGGFTPAGIPGVKNIVAPVVRNEVATNAIRNVPGSIRTLGNAVNDAVIKPVISSADTLAKGIAVASPAGQALRNKNTDLIKQADSIAKEATSDFRAGKINKQQYVTAMNELGKFNADLSKESAAVEKSANPKKLAGAAGTLASYAVGGGTLKGAKEVVKASAKLAGAGAVGGASATLEENPNASGKEIVKNAAAGAAVGAVLPGATRGVSKVVGRFRADKLAKGVDIGPVTPPEPASTIKPSTTQIPVDTSVSTVSRGKANTVDQLTYAKESQKLSKAYDNEIKPLAQFGPEKARVAQEAIDQKYVKLQDDLDARAGKTQVTFPDAQSNTVVSKTAPTEATPLPTDTPPPSDFNPSATMEGVPSAPDTGVGPKTGTSKIAKSIEQKGIEKKIITGFEDLAGFEKKNVKQEAEKVSSLIAQDTDKLRKIVRGDEELPNNISGSMLIKGAEEHAQKTGDVGLLRDLAKSPLVSETSVHAQELRLAAERNPNSAVSNIQEVLKAREKAASRRVSGSLDKAVKKEAQAIKQTVKSPTKDEWNNFISGLQCK